jgi:hypothetical protein
VIDRFMNVTVRALSPELWRALEDLFGRNGACNGCWCMYWRRGPEYHRQARERNRRALRGIVEKRPPPGLLAFDGQRAVGWCQLTPRHDLDWLNRKRAFERVDALPVWSVSCFVVRRGYRRQGVPRASGRSVPVDTGRPGSTANIFTGTVSAFRRAGFKTVARRIPSRPVMRHDLKGITD